jgi:hypothetical protein
METDVSFCFKPQVATHGMAPDSPYFEKFFVYAKPEPAHPDRSAYLHIDGAWRPTVFSEGGEPTGYYETYAEAEQALARWRNALAAAA